MTTGGWQVVSRADYDARVALRRVRVRPTVGRLDRTLTNCSHCSMCILQTICKLKSVAAYVARRRRPVGLL